MPHYVTCECLHAVPVEDPIPQVGDLVICQNCRATLRLTDVTFEPVLTAELHKPPPSFEDDEATPIDEDP